MVPGMLSSEPGSAPSRQLGSQPSLVAREGDHRLANSLQLAANFLLMEQMRVSDPVARAALGDAASRLAAVGQLHRFLTGDDAQSHVDLKPFMTELGERLTRTTRLHCLVSAESIMVPLAVAQHLAMAVNELAMNAAKHAYPRGEPDVLSIEARRRGEALQVSVADRGPGVPEGFDAARAGGLGMSILAAIVRQLGGALTVESDGGARFVITAPVHDLVPAASRSFAPARRSGL